MKYQFTASIVLYKNSVELLEEAISSFLNTELNVKLFLIDNSPDDSLRSLKTNDRIDYRFNNANIGFGAAHNLVMNGIWDISDYHIVLNPDVYFDAGTLETLLEFMEANKNVGHTMPKVLYSTGEIQYLCKENPKPFDLFARRFLPGFLKKRFQKRMDEYEYKNRDYNKTMLDIPYLSGCFMLLRTETLKKVGLFDERIFMYIEDADLTRRFLEISHTAYFPGAVIYHHYAKGSYKSLKLTWYNIHGALIYFNKWGWF